MLRVLWLQYTGHCQVFGIHMNYYMLQYPCIQYSYTHIHASIATACTCVLSNVRTITALYDQLICIPMDFTTCCLLYISEDRVLREEGGGGVEEGSRVTCVETSGVR